MNCRFAVTKAGQQPMQAGQGGHQPPQQAMWGHSHHLEFRASMAPPCACFDSAHSMHADTCQAGAMLHTSQLGGAAVRAGSFPQLHRAGGQAHSHISICSCSGPAALCEHSCGGGLQEGGGSGRQGLTGHCRGSPGGWGGESRGRHSHEHCQLAIPLPYLHGP